MSWEASLAHLQILFDNETDIVSEQGQEDAPLSSAEDQSWTDMSGILLANCMAGTTMLLLS